MNNSLRIGINALVMSSGVTGGVAIAVTELIAELGRLNLEDGQAEEYVIIGFPNEIGWLKSFMRGAQRFASDASAAAAQSNFDRSLRRAIRPLIPAISNVRNRVAGKLPPFVENRLPVSSSVRALQMEQESLLKLECDVMHFPTQHFIRIGVPCVYNPHDLQHLHYPQFFSPEAIEGRERVYREGCEHSEIVVVGSQWVKQDVVQQYGIKPDRVQVIPWAAPTHGIAAPTRENMLMVSEKYDLSRPFALYPAVTWQHKNHLRLIEAAARVRDTQGLAVTIVCTGYHTEFYEVIERHLEKYDLKGQFRFPGHVSVLELRALYRAAQFVFIPTLFEAASGPMFEAWREATPVACASVTSLPEQAHGAALLFDSQSIESIADALGEISTNRDLRDELVERGTRRLRDFSWTRTARAYRAVYKRAAGRSLFDDERRLLEWDWMRDPQRLEA